MNLSSYDICQKALDFQPERPWPEGWPPFAYENELVSGFGRTNLPVLNFTAKDVKFLHLFHQCHPRLNFSELGRIVTKWAEIKPAPCSWGALFRLYGLNQNTDFLIGQLKIFISTPLSFQKWLSEKKAHLNELRILSAVKDTRPIHFILEWIAEKNLSHSLGVKALELSGELFLMGRKPRQILNPLLPPEKALLEMEQKRKPLAFSKDQTKQNQLQKAVWPSDTTAKWLRKGDKTGLQIHIWCQTPEDLDKKTKGIKSAFHKLKPAISPGKEQ